ncbi:hypothetical protein AAOE16_18100 [Ekhidna sp. MALMAid0563]|uniref:hypothetical protein n=1 Tax=Ekhidna sp. MALMAid0563 TaxID=3143937 RepID=UPI0032DEED51
MNILRELYDDYTLSLVTDNNEERAFLSVCNFLEDRGDVFPESAVDVVLNEVYTLSKKYRAAWFGKNKILQNSRKRFLQKLEDSFKDENRSKETEGSIQ